MAANFYVHIVECPSPRELLDGQTEGRALCSFLHVAQIPFLYNLAIDDEQFTIALTQRIHYGSQQFGRPPILHLSAHGSDQGIQLAHQRKTQQYIPWSLLARHIRPIRDTWKDLGLCMSSCGGGHERRMAEVIRAEDVPFAWIVGPTVPVDLRDAALAFAVFYRRLQVGKSGEAIEAMRVASGVQQFDIAVGDLTQQQYTASVTQAYQQPLAQNPPWGQAGGTQ